MKGVLILLQLSATLAFSQTPDSLITKQSLYNNVSFLASDSLKGRMTGSFGSTVAANYIREFFKQHQVRPLSVFSNYYDSFSVNTTITGLNVVGAVPGYASDSLIIVSAHYDHIGKGGFGYTQKTPNSDDNIYNGANDNATGIAAMMELAKYFAAYRHNYYTIIFVAFSGEEMGLLGSKHFAKYIDDPKRIKAVINLEMLGRPYYEEHCFYTGFTSFKTIKAINKFVNSKTGVKTFLYDDPFPNQNLQIRSDHYPFAFNGFDSFTIMGSSPEDMYYHSVNDETETIDFDFLLFAVKNIAAVVEYFGN